MDQIHTEFEITNGIPDFLRTNIGRLISGSLTNTAELIQTKRDLGRTKLAQELCKRQKAEKNVQLKTRVILLVAGGRDLVQRRALDDIEMARKMVEAADQKLVRSAERAFEGVAKVARKKRANSSLKPLYIIDRFGGGRELVRG